MRIASEQEKRQRREDARRAKEVRTIMAAGFSREEAERVAKRLAGERNAKKIDTLFRELIRNL